mmetsp:Transcript_6953/g.20324  ORF Transcript_6953/g.20324 Transcript_6953/m.20324 type:complete len:240 (+) Transcript_6953:1448-2167(+)
MESSEGCCCCCCRGRGRRARDALIYGADGGPGGGRQGEYARQGSGEDGRAGGRDAGQDLFRQDGRAEGDRGEREGVVRSARASWHEPEFSEAEGVVVPAELERFGGLPKPRLPGSQQAPDEDAPAEGQEPSELEGNDVQLSDPENSFAGGGGQGGELQGRGGVQPRQKGQETDAPPRGGLALLHLLCGVAVFHDGLGFHVHGLLGAVLCRVCPGGLSVGPPSGDSGFHGGVGLRFLRAF